MSHLFEKLNAMGPVWMEWVGGRQKAKASTSQGGAPPEEISNTKRAGSNLHMLFPRGRSRESALQRASQSGTFPLQQTPLMLFDFVGEQNTGGKGAALGEHWLCAQCRACDFPNPGLWASPRPCQAET